jgi:hypothetical protein
MGEIVQCDLHGEQDSGFACAHLLSSECAQGFNHVASDTSTLPDAWCDNCEIVRKQVNGWDDETTKLADIKLLCAVCYNRARIRNTKPDVTLDDLADLKWKCHTCEEWHSGPCLDFAYDLPDMWSDADEEQHKKSRLFPSFSKKRNTWRDEDYAG